MKAKYEYAGRAFWAVAEEIYVSRGGSLVGGQFYGAFSLTDDPLNMIAGETVKSLNPEGQAVTRLFPSPEEALAAAAEAARNRLDGRTGEMV